MADLVFMFLVSYLLTELWLVHPSEEFWEYVQERAS